MTNYATFCSLHYFEKSGIHIKEAEDTSFPILITLTHLISVLLLGTYMCLDVLLLLIKLFCILIL